MSEKVTKGPWFVDGGIVLANATGGAAETFRVVRGQFADVAYLFPWDGEVEANARLIAAAPALLEAARVALGCDHAKPGLCDQCRSRVSAAVANASAE